MIEVATALLKLPDSSLVMQRRREDHHLNPGMLGLFGGHLEAIDNNNPEYALQRELEETTLVLGELSIVRYTSFFMPERLMGDDLWYHMYEIPIVDASFTTSDGQIEIISSNNLLCRDDIEPAARFAMERSL